MMKTHKGGVKLTGPENGALEESKHELISMIAHATRTPLTIIKEGVSLVLDEIPGGLNPGQKKILIAVKRNTDRLIKSVEEILRAPWHEAVASVKRGIYAGPEGKRPPCAQKKDAGRKRRGAGQ